MCVFNQKAISKQVNGLQRMMMGCQRSHPLVRNEYNMEICLEDWNYNIFFLSWNVSNVFDLPRLFNFLIKVLKNLKVKYFNNAMTNYCFINCHNKGPHLKYNGDGFIFQLLIPKKKNSDLTRSDLSLESFN